MTFESKPPLGDVAVCARMSLLTHTIVSPAFTSICAGVKLAASMVTVWVAGLRAAGRCALTTAPQALATQTAASTRSRTDRAVTAYPRTTGGASRARGA